MDATVSQWFVNPDFRALSTNAKRSVLRNYFDATAGQDQEFTALDQPTRWGARENFTDQHLTAFQDPAPERGLVKDLAVSVARAPAEIGALFLRGASGAAEAVSPGDSQEAGTRGQLRDAAETLTDWNEDTFPLSANTEKSYLRRSLTRGLESAAVSLGSKAPGAAAGAGAGFLLGGPPGALAGGMIGYLSGVPLFGANQFDEAKTEYLKKGYSEADATAAATKMAASEMGYEFVSDAIELATLGQGSILTRPGKELLKESLEGTIRQSWKQAAKKAGTMTVAESAGELGNTATQAAIAQQYDPSAPAIMDEIGNQLGPILVASAIFGGIGGGIGLAQRRQLTTSLTTPVDESAPPKKAEAQLASRLAAVKEVAETIGKTSKPLAEQWRKNAMEVIRANQPLDLSLSPEDFAGISADVAADQALSSTGMAATETATQSNLAQAAAEVAESTRQERRTLILEAERAAAGRREETTRTILDQVLPAIGILSPGQRSAVEAKVQELGSLEAVTAAFPGEDVVDRHARALATEMYPPAPQPAAAAAQPAQASPDPQPTPVQPTVVDIDRVVADAVAAQAAPPATQTPAPPAASQPETPAVDIERIVADTVAAQAAGRRRAVETLTGRRPVTQRPGLPEILAVEIQGHQVKVLPPGPGKMMYQAFVPAANSSSVLVKHGLPLTAAGSTQEEAIRRLQEKIEQPAKTTNAPPYLSTEIDKTRDKQTAIPVVVEQPGQRFIPENVASIRAMKEDANGLVPVKTVRGRIAYINKGEYLDVVDNNRDKNVLRAYAKTGERIDNGIHIANIDPTGLTQQQINNDFGVPDLWYRQTEKGSFPFATIPAARREISKHGWGKSHEVIPADELIKGMTGYLIQRKKDADISKEATNAQADKVNTETPAAETGEVVAAVAGGNESAEGGVPDAVAGGVEQSSERTKPAKDDKEEPFFKKGNRVRLDSGKMATVSDVVTYKKAVMHMSRSEGVTPIPYYEHSYSVKTDDGKEDFGHFSKMDLAGGEKKAEPKAYGASNKLFTADAAEKARELLRKKLGQVNAGLDPEMVQAGIQLAGYHIEAGSRSFTAYTKAMIADLGEAVRPYLRGWYEAVRYYPGFNAEEMTAADQIQDTTPVKDSVDNPPLHADNKDKAPASEKGNDNADLHGETRTTAIHAGPDQSPAQDDRAGDTGQSPGSVRRAEGQQGVDPVRADEGNGDDGGVRLGDRRDHVGDDDNPGRSAAPGAHSDTQQQDRRGVAKRTGKSPGVSDHRIEPGGLKRQGSWRETAARNLDIIELVKRLDAEKRQATPEEKTLLVKYTGFGASELANNLFPGYGQYGRIYDSMAKPEWKELVARVQQVLTPEELATAVRSTQYAHYTSEAVIRSIYKALERFGFTGGKVLEPGSGPGGFWGLMPDTMHRRSGYTGIEMDHLTAAIAKHLYPSQNIIQGDYTKQALPENFFDLGLGNPPFAATVILADPAYKKHRFKLHDYFFAKTIDKVRPGGLLVFVTSRYTMDKADAKARNYLADRADLLGAIRLPQTAFQQNAGTEVVTDVLFLRKRVDAEQPGGQPWAALAEVSTPEGPIQINEYFSANPSMVLGRHSLTSGRYQGNEYTVLPLDGDIETHFAEAVNRLPENVYSAVKAPAAQQKAAVVERDFNPKNKKEGGLYLNGAGVLMKVEAGAGKALDEKLSAKDREWLNGYVELRDAVKQAQSDQLHDLDWEASLKKANQAYDRFAKHHGSILAHTLSERTKLNEDGEEVTSVSKRYKNKRLYSLDVENSLVAVLEKELEGGKVEKGAFLLGRTIQKPVRKPPETLTEALTMSLDEQGHLDLDYIADKLALDRAEVVSGLDEQIFEDHAKPGAWQTRDEYLSGNVVEKLAEAEVAAKADKRFARNVEALQQVQPAPLTARDVTVSLGAPWVDAKVVSTFADEILSAPMAVRYAPEANLWQVSPIGRGKSKQSGRNSLSDWGTDDRAPNEIMDAVLNNRSLTIRRTVKDPDGSTRTFTDTTASAAVNDIARKMRERFSSWVWQDADRAGTLLAEYNRRYNNLAPRKFDGTHLTLPGVSLRFKLHDHQKAAIWRAIQTGNSYFAHAVGAGKTIEMIAAGMEMRRMGLVQKPMYVVPKHMLQQFANEFQELYPLAHIMVADEENFHTDNRRRFMAQAALNNPDAVIITHPSLMKLSVTKESVSPVREAMIDDLRATIADLRDDDAQANRILIKKMEARVEQLGQMFDSLVAGDKDRAISFEEMGVDFMFVDEAHEFRKLDFVTNRQAKGIDSNGSKKTLDLYIKTKILEAMRPGRSHIFASGTPVTNTMGELYSLMRFFAEEQMEKDGIRHFDAWAAMFGEIAPGFERNAAGNYEMVERFAKFVNVPELMSRVRSFMDVLTFSDLGAAVKRPDLEGGIPKMVLAPQSPAMKDYLKRVLADRIKISKAWKPSKDQPGNPDPIINIITDGRLASIDMRFVNPSGQSDPNSKLNKMVDGVIETWRDTKATKYQATGSKKNPPGAAQIVFFNHGFGAGIKKNRGFDARAWMMHRLREASIPAHEVAWIEDYNTAAKKEAMFEQVRQGQVRILIGSAKRMGTGVNVQNRLHTLHYLDAPWYPADVEQPHGRILRQGNQNGTVRINWYASEGSYDSTMWQMVARKAKFIEQALSGDASVRTLEDVSEVSSYEMATALSSGDQRVIQLAGLKSDLERLHRLQQAHHADQINLRGKLRTLEQQEAREGKRVKELAAAAAKVPGHIREAQGEVAGKSFDKRDELGAALQTHYQAVIQENFEKGRAGLFEVGKVNGFVVAVNVKAVSQDSPMILTVTKDVHIAIDPAGEPAGLVTRIVNQLNGLGRMQHAGEDRVKELIGERAKVQNRIGTPFEYDQELHTKTAEAATLEAELMADGKEQDAGQVISEDVLAAIGDAEKAEQDEGDGSAKLSVASRAKPTGTSIEQVETELRAGILGRAGVEKLQKFGKLEVVRTEIGLPAGVRENARFMVAWHGSPHKFDKFSAEKIGTGEGAQVYGHGLYFAGNREVAEHYRKTLSNPYHRVSFRGKEVSPSAITNDLARQFGLSAGDAFHLRAIVDAFSFGDLGKVRQTVAERIAELKKLGEFTGNLDRRLAFLDANKDAFEAEKPGNTYQVELAPAEDEYLLWDKPLSEQSEKVKAALESGGVVSFERQRFNQEMQDKYKWGWASQEGRKKLTAGERAQLEGYEAGDNTESRIPGSYGDIDGSSLYRKTTDEQGSDKAASEYLHSLGVRGIKYLDGSSRNRPLREIKAEFLTELPEDATMEEVEALVGTGKFSPKNEALIQALAADDWLGFSYPAQAITAALGKDLGNYAASPALKSAVAAAKDGGTYNFVIFSDEDVTVKALYSRDARVVGAYHNGKVWLVSDAMLPGDADFVLRHEGLHMILEESPSFKRDKSGLLEQFESLAETSPGVRAAFAQVPIDTPAEDRTEEAWAYFVQDPANHQHSLFRRLIAAIKAWLVRHNIPVGKLNEADFIALATQGVKSHVRQLDPAAPEVAGSPYAPGEPAVIRTPFYSRREVTTAPQEVAADIEADRTFANRLFEQRDVAIHLAGVQIAELQKRVQALAGRDSRRSFSGPFAYDQKLKRSQTSDQLDAALLVWRDLQINPEKAEDFRVWAKERLADTKLPGPTRIRIKEQLATLDQADKLTDEQKALADEIGNRFEQLYQVAKANKVVTAFRENYVRRIWSFPEGSNISGGDGSGHGFRVTTSARKHRSLETVLDGWMAGYDLAIKGLTNSYGTYLTQLEEILANKDFLRLGYHTRDLEGNRLFSTKRLPGYTELAAAGFKVWEWAGTAKAHPLDGHELLVDDYGRKFFFGKVDRIPEHWVVKKRTPEPDDAAGDSDPLSDPPTRSTSFDNEEAAKAFAAAQDFETDIEHIPVTDQATAWEERRLYAPAQLAEMINKMTAADNWFVKTPGANTLLRFNAGLKSWILMSSFFHHYAGARSWAFGVHHGWLPGKVIDPTTGKELKTVGVNPIKAYKMGLQKIESLHPLITMGVKHGLTLGEMQDWSERALRESKGISRRLAERLGLEKTDKAMAKGSFLRESFSDSLFKRFFAGLKAESFVIEFAHEVQLAQKAHASGKAPAPDPNKIAERVARLINEDFGGLHLQRMGRNPTLQKVSRLLLLAPDWTESNFRTVTGLIPGVNEWISKMIGDIPPTPGMRSVYNRFYAKIAVRIALSTILLQLMINGWDDTEEFYTEQFATWDQFKKFRWTGVDISKIYEALGIDLEGKRKVLSLGGHFFDPLKLIDPPALIKGKGSPLTRIAESGFSASDWAGRPFTGAGELLATGKTIKKSPYQGKEDFHTRLPSWVANTVISMQPVQVGYLIRYWQGEEDALSALGLATGLYLKTAWPAKVTGPVIDSKDSADDQAVEEISRLQKSGALTMGPPSSTVHFDGISRKMTTPEYQRYLERSSRLATEKITRAAKTPRWASIEEEKQAEIVEKIVKASRRQARSEIKRQWYLDRKKTQVQPSPQGQ